MLEKLEHYGSMVSDGLGQVAVTGRAVAYERSVLYRSTDAGATWQAVGLPHDLGLVEALRLTARPAARSSQTTTMSFIAATIAA